MPCLWDAPGETGRGRTRSLLHKISEWNTPGLRRFRETGVRGGTAGHTPQKAGETRLGLSRFSFRSLYVFRRSGHVGPRNRDGAPAEGGRQGSYTQILRPPGRSPAAGRAPARRSRPAAFPGGRSPAKSAPPGPGGPPRTSPPADSSATRPPPGPPRRR